MLPLLFRFSEDRRDLKEVSAEETCLLASKSYTQVVAV